MAIDSVGPKTTPVAPKPIEPAKVEQAKPIEAEAKVADPSFKQKLGEGFDAFKKKLMSTTGKYVAHQVVAPDRPDLKNDVSAMRSSINAGGGQFVGASLVAQNASAEREMAPIGPNQQVNIFDRDLRNQVIRNAPQVNEVSKKAGNAGDCCGGAAMSNALIMTSDTPEKAKANAKAVRDLAGSLQTDPKKPFIKPEEEKALKNLESGKMSPTDSMHMQQLMYRIEGRMPSMVANPNDAGRSTGQVGCALTMLKARGGFPGPEDVTFHCNTSKVPVSAENPTGKGADHWTVTVGRTHANSMVGEKAGSTVTGGPPPELSRSREGWQNEISLYNSETPPKVVSQFKGNPTDAGYHEAEFDPSQFGQLESFGKYEDAMRKANAQPQKPID